MGSNSDRVCIILARAGSKRIPNKNLQLINGKTLVDYAVECCTENNLKTIVSSDSDLVLSNIKYQSVIKHKRSILNSEDLSTSEDALIEVLETYKITSDTEVILIPPTNPLRSAQDLRAFLIEWDSKGKINGFDQAFSVMPMQNDFWFEKTGKFKRLRDVIFDSVEPRVTSKRKKIYLETSAIYLSYAHLLYAGLSLIGSNPLPIELSKLASIDIDTPMDLEIARKLMPK